MKAMSIAELPFFSVILERTDGNIGSDRISSQPSTNFQKSILSFAMRFYRGLRLSRMTGAWRFLVR